MPSRSQSARALLIVGHGPNTAEKNAALMQHLRPVAERVKAMTGFRDVRVDLVRDDAPPAVRAEAVKHVRELVEPQQALTGADLHVVPVLVSKGQVSRDKLPADLRGTPPVYAGDPLLLHPAMVRWIESRAGGCWAAARSGARRSPRHRRTSPFPERLCSLDIGEGGMYSDTRVG